jgi:hypothetical protein
LVSDLLSGLTDIGYDKEISDYKFTEHRDVILNYAVWDVEKGTILKLAEGGYITHAMLGF